MATSVDCDVGSLEIDRQGSLSGRTISKSIDEHTNASMIQSPSSITHVHTNRQQRHSKRLSLNFPIMLPTTRSDTVASPYFGSPKSQSAHQIYNSSPYFLAPSHSHHISAPSTSTLPMPLTPPSESSEDVASTNVFREQDKRNAHKRSQSTISQRQTWTSSPPDFLTLLASQERRVLELKEELARAERDLTKLKKSWALHEAGKKKTELRAGTMKMSTIPASTATSPVHVRHSETSPTGTGLGLTAGTNEDVLAEEKRKEFVKENLNRRGTLENVHNTPNGKRTGQRVFSGSRHTRALSLLSTKPLYSSERKSSMEEFGISNPLPNLRPMLKTSPDIESTIFPTLNESLEPDQSPISTMPNLTRTNSGYSKDPLNFGKTYKELASAASRRSVPQGLQAMNGGAEVLVKQGKIVVDGVRDGLWNFFEDIRQATVGEEAARDVSESGGLDKAKTRKSSKDKEQSFWREFGVETPKGDKGKSKPVEGETPICSRHGHGRSVRIGRKTSHPSLSETTPSRPSPLSLSNSTTTTSSNLSPSSKAEFSTPKPKSKDRDHESKSSTDSGDSRNPPSLLSDSFQEEAEDEEESWEWKSVDSPMSVKVRDGGEKLNTTMTKSKDKDRESGIKEVKWHELTS